MRRIALAAGAAAAWLALASPVRAEPLNPLDFPSLGTVTLAGGTYTIDTSATPPTLTGPDTNLSGTVLTGIAGPDIAVFSFDSLNVNTGAVINVSGTRPVAMLAGGNLTFGGTLNASGGAGADYSGTIGGAGGAGGPGGYAGGRGGWDRWAGPPDGCSGRGLGGGDGAHSRPESYGWGGGGGFGGSGDGSSGGIAGGPVNGVQPNFQLSGGSGGGGGGGSNYQIGGGGGGGGGGAVELGALGTLTLTGSTINANGGSGGIGGSDVMDSGRGGGGSGGAVLVHGSTVTLGVAINAGGNGGVSGGVSGGGGGRVAIQATADPGTTGISVAGGTYGGASGVISSAQSALTPTNLYCGAVLVGSSVTLFMGIQNTGAAGSFINGRFPAAAGPFARVGTGVFSGLRQNALTACPYTFHPTTIGPFSQNLTFLSNAGLVGVTISGTGVAVCRGDFNGDGLFDAQDISGFVAALLAGEPCPPPCKGDFNNDGLFNGQDIQGFVDALLAGEPCP